MGQTKVTEKYDVFARLHDQGKTFILPNAWDVSSAKIFKDMGFKAIGTTSAGIALSLGYQDGENIPFDEVLAVVDRIVKSVDIPVSVDMEAGYGSSIEEVVENAKKLMELGVVGINLEDGTNHPTEPIVSSTAHVEKITAIRALSKSLHQPLFINARTDFFWLNLHDKNTQLQSTITRAKKYKEAGADCIFVPGNLARETIERLRKEIAGPINLLSSPTLPTLEALAEIGIERVSTGSAPYRATVTLLKKISEQLYQENFDALNDSVMSYAAVQDLLK